jgi:geranylgeranyl diphosphate synthase type II
MTRANPGDNEFDASYAARVGARAEFGGLSRYMDDCRGLVNEEIRRLFDHRLDHHEVLYDLILDYPMRDGKALRPTLSIAMCRACGGNVEAVLPTAATLELYHNAFLVHDDIEDDSLMRRGKPTLHVDHGVPIAVNVGDAMLCLSLQPLLDNVAVVGLGPALRILEAVARMTRESVEGQAIELDWIRHNRCDLEDDDYVEMVVQKTGWYSFIVPMQVGAIAAGASNDEVDELVAFGRDLSVAFQITDDLLNVRADPEEYGKEIGGDLWEGKRTLILLHAMRTATDTERARAVAILAKGRPPSEETSRMQHELDELVRAGALTDDGRARIEDAVWGSRSAGKTMDDVQWLFGLLEQQGSVEYAAEVARGFAESATDRLEQLAWLPPSSHRDVVEGLVEYVHGRTK